MVITIQREENLTKKKLKERKIHGLFTNSEKHFYKNKKYHTYAKRKYCYRVKTSEEYIANHYSNYNMHNTIYQFMTTTKTFITELKTY